MNDFVNVKRPELLKESNRDFDFFDFQSKAKNLYNSLKSDMAPTVTVLIGDYGTGKSVLLNEVRKLTKQSKTSEKSKWVFFECWQYPDKRDLWEALILELVAEIDGKNLDEEAKNYSDIKNWRDKLVEFLSDAKAALGTLVGAAIVYWLVFNSATDEVKNILMAVTVATVLVLLASLQVLIKPQTKSTISRLSDYKSELEKTIRKYQGPLYIVLEDVDRAGELGRRFFETVSHFVKSDKFAKKNIKVIVPITGMDEVEGRPLRDSIDKASDNILFFSTRYDCEQFITEIFSKEFLDEPTKLLITSTVNPLLGNSISVRKMKHLFRNALTKHRRLLNKDLGSQLAICIAVEFSKHMSTGFGDSNLYAQAGGSYRHEPLYKWASQKELLDFSADDTTKEVQARDYFKVSDEVFADIRYKDTPTGSYRSREIQIYSREFYISRAYFNDL